LIPIDKFYSCIIVLKIHYPLKQQFCQSGTAGSRKKFSAVAQFEIPQLFLTTKNFLYAILLLPR